MIKKYLVLQVIKSKLCQPILQLKYITKNHSLEINRALSENIFIFLLQYIGVTISILSPSPVWLASGTACGFMFLRGPTIGFGIWCGTFIAYAINLHAITLAVVSATIHTLQAFSILRLNYGLKNPTLIFYTLNTFLKCISGIIIISALTSFCLFSIFNSTYYNSTFLVTWLANLCGILLFSFCIVAWDMYFPDIKMLGTKNLTQYILFILIYCVLNFIAVMQNNLLLSVLLIILAFYFALLMTKTYDWYGLIFANAIFSLLILFGCLGFISVTLTRFFIIQSIILLNMIFGLGINILRYNKRTALEAL